jgi:hypothetical protein
LSECNQAVVLRLLIIRHRVRRQQSLARVLMTLPSEHHR